MPITRLPLEIELVDRTGGLLALVGKSTAATGSNPNLTGPIGFAIEHLGGSVVTPGTVTDTDLSTLDDSLFYSICDLAEYRIIVNAVLNFTQPDQTLSLQKQDLDKMMKRFQDRADFLATQYAALLNIRRNPMQVGPVKVKGPRPYEASRFGLPDRGVWYDGHS